MRARGRAGTGAWMDEERGAAQLEAREHRAQARVGGDAREGARGQTRPCAATIEDTVDVVGVGRVNGDCAPHAEGSAKREGAVEIGVDQRQSEGARKRLDPQGAGEAQQGAVEPVELDKGSAMVAGLVDRSSTKGRSPARHG